MAKVPVVWKTKSRVKFYELDAYRHLGAAQYASYFMEHRYAGARENMGWDFATIMKLPYAIWVQKLDIEYLLPVFGDEEISISSFVREYKGFQAFVELEMTNSQGGVVSRCKMVGVCIEKKTLRPMDWPAEVVAASFKEDGA